MSFTDLPQDYNPWEAAAARVRARYPVREPDPTAAAASNMPAGQMWGALAGGAAQSAATLPERAFQSAGSLQYGGSYDPGPILEAAMLPMAGTAFGGPPGAIGAGPIRAYHGSPYDFERFDISKIGTGEGAQAYGHGLYFAENPAVAKSYRDMLEGTVAGRRFDINDPLHKATHLIDEFGSRASALKEAKYRMRHDPGDYYGDVARILESQKPLPEYKSGGRMYEVNIRADPEEFLNWDKPFMGQSPQVQKQLTENWLGDPSLGSSGAEIYNQATGRFESGNYFRPSASARSGVFREAGIPGIRYLDQGSRGALPDLRIKHVGGVKEGEWQLLQGDKNLGTFRTVEAAREAKAAEFAKTPTTSNYVLFRDDIIDILRKYGLAGGMAGSALPYALAPSGELRQ